MSTNLPPHPMPGDPLPAHPESGVAIPAAVGTLFQTQKGSQRIAQIKPDELMAGSDARGGFGGFRAHAGVRFAMGDLLHPGDLIESAVLAFVVENGRQSYIPTPTATIFCIGSPASTPTPTPVELGDFDVAGRLLGTVAVPLNQTPWVAGPHEVDVTEFVREAAFWRVSAIFIKLVVEDGKGVITLAASTAHGQLPTLILRTTPAGPAGLNKFGPT